MGGHLAHPKVKMKPARRQATSPAPGSGCCLYGFFAAFSVGVLLVHDPGVG